MCVCVYLCVCMHVCVHACVCVCVQSVCVCVVCMGLSSVLQQMCRCVSCVRVCLVCVDICSAVCDVPHVQAIMFVSLFAVCAPLMLVTVGHGCMVLGPDSNSGSHVTSSSGLCGL